MLPTQTPSGPPRMSRLGIFTSRQTPSRPGPSSPLAREADDDQDDDWYIPYNGPYETPKRQQPLPHSGDSWGELLNGWLSEDDGHGKRGGYRQEGRVSQATSAPEDRSRSRAVSGASRLTHSTGGPDANGKNNGARNHQLRASARQRAPTLSYIDLDRSGGVGASPTPIERSSSQPLADTSRLQPSSNRTSLASIFTFGRKSLRLSASMDNLAQARSRNSSRDKVNTPVEPAPPPVPPVRTIPARPRAQTTAASTSPTQGRMSADDEYYNTYYNTLVVTPGKNHAPPTGDSDTTDTSMRSHPYAYPFPSADVPEALQSAPPVVDKGKGRLLVPRKLSITLLDPRGPKVPAYLKPSPRSSVLKASLSTPNLRNIPKGKQRWLSAETWCDALILPRPRFALRLVDTTGASGRIVSPPPSPILPTRTPDPNTIQPRPGLNTQKALKKARSMGNLISTSRSPTPPEQRKRDITPDPLPPVPVAGSSTLKPPRPRSFAWDDLALPSPVPSLAKYVLFLTHLVYPVRQGFYHHGFACLIPHDLISSLTNLFSSGFLKKAGNLKRSARNGKRRQAGPSLTSALEICHELAQSPSVLLDRTLGARARMQQPRLKLLLNVRCWATRSVLLQYTYTVHRLREVEPVIIRAVTARVRRCLVMARQHCSLRLRTAHSTVQVQVGQGRMPIPTPLEIHCQLNLCPANLPVRLATRDLIPLERPRSNLSFRLLLVRLHSAV